MYTSYFEESNQMSRFDRFRINYPLLWRVIQVKENQISNSKTQLIKPIKQTNK